MNNVLRRRGLLGFAASLWAGAAWSQLAAFPERPITFVLPFPAGGATDVIARMVAEKLQARVGRPVVVDNRPGGNTLVATNYVRTLPADGHALYFMTSTVIEQPALRPKTARFDPVTDLTPITYLGKVGMVLLVNQDLPARNVAQFLQLAKSKPQGLTMATIGTGSADHLAGEMIAAKTGAKLLTVPYKGAAPALTDVAAGVVDARISDFASARPFIDSGKVRVIASAELKRAPGSKLETVAETIPGMEAPVWLGVMGPKGMPPSLIQLLNSHFVAIIQMPDVQAKLRGLDMEPVSSTPEELRASIQARMADVRQIVRDRNLSFDE